MLPNTGCRPLTDLEISALLAGCQSRYALRDRAFITLGIYTGYRAGELLSLTVGDVWSGTAIHAAVTVGKNAMKGRNSSRTVPLHSNAKLALEHWIIAAKLTNLRFQHWPLFPRQRRCRPMTRHQSRNIIRRAAEKAGIELQRVANHTLRKTFARRLWDSPHVGKDPARMARLLGHTNWSNTLRYLQFTDLEVAILA